MSFGDVWCPPQMLVPAVPTNLATVHMAVCGWSDASTLSQFFSTVLL